MPSDCRHHFVLDSVPPPTPGGCVLCGEVAQFSGGMVEMSGRTHWPQPGRVRGIAEQAAVLHSIASSGLYDGVIGELHW
jgi:hypothetical protein